MSSFDGFVGGFDGEERCHPASARGFHGGRGVPDASDQASPALDGLLRTIEGEIIPRLMVAHGVQRRSPHTATEPPGAAHVDELTLIVRTRGAQAALSYARSVQADGMPVAAIYLELLAPVARKLGRMWETDECGFAEVTLGLCHLHYVMRELSPCLAGEEERARGRAVLLLPAPGEQHMFGLLMVANFFQRAGWEVTTGPAETAPRLLQMVRRERYDLVGLSVSTQSALAALPGQLQELRRASRNAEVGVLVGGPLFAAQPELVEEVGADGTGVDAAGAVLWAEQFLSR